MAEQAAARKGDSIWSVTFVVLCFISLFQSIGQFMMNTILPLYADSFGATPTVVGIAVGCFAITALLTRPFATPAFDSFSKKKIFFCAILLVMVCSFLYGFVRSVPALIAVRMLHGFAMGCTGPLALALATESLPPSHLGRGISIFSLAMTVAQALGPALGLWLIDAVGFIWTFRIAGISMIVAAILILFIKERPNPLRPPYKIEFKRIIAVGAIPPALLTCIFSSCNTSVMSFIALYANALGVAGIGVYFVINSILMLGTRPLFGRLVDRFGYRPVIIPALIAFAVAFVVIAYARTLEMFMVAGVITACGYGACIPQLQALAMGSVPRSRSGAASGTHFTGLDIAMLFGPIISGSVAETFHGITGDTVAGYSDMYLVAAAVVVAGIVLFCLLYPRMMRNIERANEINRINREKRLKIRKEQEAINANTPKADE